MKTFIGLLGTTALVLLAGCGSTTTYVRAPSTPLGRVVVYRNGIAYFERSARVEGDILKLSVPADKVDDFLKSLTVTDAKTGEPSPVSYPTRLPSSSTGLIDMEIRLAGPSPHEVKLTYVTEATSWKPTYRVMLANNGAVGIEAWAVIDNTSGEDWENVNLAVGSSSALSFKFDLKSVRMVGRETLNAEDVFAVSPPSGGSVFGDEEANLVALIELSDSQLSKSADLRDDGRVALGPETKAASPGKKGERFRFGSGAAGAASGATVTTASPTSPPPPYATSASQSELDRLANKLRATNKPIVIEGFAAVGDNDKEAASLDRANKARDQLMKRGVLPGNVVAVGKGHLVGKDVGGVRVVEAVAVHEKNTGTEPNAEMRDPIGTSHFESGARMSVKRGSSAMVSMLKGQTEGEVTYYFDPESPRGNATYPFRAIRIKNPTNSTLDSGPVTVFGEGKFIGEGISEPIPPHASAFIPFALDRQIVVEQTSGERDAVSRIISVQRGVFATELQHTKTVKLMLHNHLATKAKVSMRHTVPAGYKLNEHGFTVERIGTAHMLGVEIEGGAKKEVVIEESTPVFKTIDLRSPGGIDLVAFYLTSTAFAGPLKGEVEKLVKLQQEIGNFMQKVSTMREQMGEYRTRMDELHAQIVTLNLVKSAGPLMKDLEKKLQEMSDRLSKSTIDLVSVQEQLMMTRILFQDGVAELTLNKAEPKRLNAGSVAAAQ
ncbi:MAG: hypothetical protein NVS3B20_13250 [Polyangiales bacterium]